MSREHPTIDVHVALLDEGTPVWRPTRATALGDGRYRLLPVPGIAADDEHWAVAAGSVVRIERQEIGGDEVLVAVAIEESPT